MKTKMNTFLGAVLALLVLTLTTNAATQVYDLKTDWSDTQNPNGTWSYRAAEGSLLQSDPFPWVLVDGSGVSEALTKTTAASAVPGYLEVGDISVISYSGVSVRWTAPANGTINVSGAMWNGTSDDTAGQWMLTRNGINLSDGFWTSSSRNSPDELSFGSAGANGLLNITIQAGDQVELSFSDWHLFGLTPIGINFTVTFTPESIDPVAAIENLAIAVFEMNLQNGIENSLDSKLDAAIAVLIDVNLNNDGAACNSLAAFISAVEAQRGKKITNAQADALIAAAQEIQVTLNCGN